MKEERAVKVFRGGEGSVPIKAFIDHVGTPEKGAMEQLYACADLPFIHKHVAVMPDVHQGYGATVGSVIPTRGAIVPSAVGVDIGCGMMAHRTGLTSHDLPDSMKGVRSEIERVVPHGRTANGKRGTDHGGWGTTPDNVLSEWNLQLGGGWDEIVSKHPKLDSGNLENHLGTLGTGNHFIELCLDEEDRVWIMLHSGSRGVGNRIGTYFINLAKKDCEKWFVSLPAKDLAYFAEGSEHFDDYVEAVGWAQDFARINREIMMAAVIRTLQAELRGWRMDHESAVNCHHNYVERENHFGANVWVTRKGAVRAREGDMGIIPGSMGERSFIVRGKGNADSFHSCSHGAGRKMSRTKAKATFTLEDHAKATEGVECRKDEGVLDETPGAYKNIDAVMASQTELVDIVHTLKQFVCVKG